MLRFAAGTETWPQAMLAVRVGRCDVIFDDRAFRKECRRHGVQALNFESTIDCAHQLLAVLPTSVPTLNRLGDPIELRHTYGATWALAIGDYRFCGRFEACVLRIAQRCEPRAPGQSCTA